MIYESRVYRCVPGRLSDVLKRFDKSVLRYWEKHGHRQSGFWTTMVGESNHDVTYMLAWESVEEMNEKRTAFISDPEWGRERAESEKNGPLIQTISNQLLLPTAFSTLK